MQHERKYVHKKRGQITLVALSTAFVIVQRQEKIRIRDFSYPDFFNQVHTSRYKADSISLPEQ